MASSTAPETSRLLEQHRPALTGHCYRMLGSISEADDAVQETMVRAWKSFDQLEGQAALKGWLYRIATRVCLDALEGRKHRVRSLELGPPRTEGSMEQLPDSAFVEPIPDAYALPTDESPERQLFLRQSIRLAFVAALQHLPPKQRAVLLLTEVLGWSSAETADYLELSVASVNSALQRARASLESKGLHQGTDVALPTTDTLSQKQRALVDDYVEAFERYDLQRLTSLLHQDATLSMPPYLMWFQGQGSIRDWMSSPGGRGCKGSRLLRTSANGLPAFAQYRPPSQPGDPYEAWALITLELSEDGNEISGLTSFLDVKTLFPRFGFSLTLA